MSYPDTQNLPLPDRPPTDDHISFLSEFLDPVYLQPRTMKALAVRFSEESSLELHSFLCALLAKKLENGLHEVDAVDGLGESCRGRIPPPHDVGMSSAAWTIKVHLTGGATVCRNFTFTAGGVIVNEKIILRILNIILG